MDWEGRPKSKPFSHSANEPLRLRWCGPGTRIRKKLMKTHHVCMWEGFADITGIMMQGQLVQRKRELANSQFSRIKHPWALAPNLCWSLCESGTRRQTPRSFLNQGFFFAPSNFQNWWWQRRTVIAISPLVGFLYSKSWWFSPSRKLRPRSGKWDVLCAFSFNSAGIWWQWRLF